MHRFFVSAEVIQEDVVELTGSIAHQLAHVLRLRAGQYIEVLDDSGLEYTVELQAVASDRVVGHVRRRSPSVAEPRAQVTLYQAVLKSDRFEWVLQKGTELGIVRFVPLLSSRVVPRDQQAVQKKRDRWERIIKEAAEQSRRGRLPRLERLHDFEDACRHAAGAGGIGLMAWEEEAALDLKQALSPALHELRSSGQQELAMARIQVFIGPEGGFTPEEVSLAQDHGIQPVTLGPRIFRAETAGLVAATIILYETGDLA